MALRTGGDGAVVEADLAEEITDGEPVKCLPVVENLLVGVEVVLALSVFSVNGAFGVGFTFLAN